MAKAKEIDEIIVEFCRNATDAQLIEILKKEWDAYEHRDYVSARVAAAERGWRVLHGEKLA